LLALFCLPYAADFSLLETYQNPVKKPARFGLAHQRFLVGTMILKHPKTNLPHGSSTQQKPFASNMFLAPFLHQHCPEALLEEIIP